MYINSLHVYTMFTSNHDSGTCISIACTFISWLLLIMTRTLVSYNVYKTLQHVLSPEKRKYDSITPVLISLHWLPVHYRCQYKLLIYVYKAQQGKAPSYLQELITPYKPNRALRSENSMLLHPPNDVRTKSYGERRFDKARLRSGTVYPCHCGMWLLWRF